jgi:uncharacterized protein
MDRPERAQKIRFPQPLRLVIVLAAPFVLSSCASLPAAQERVRVASETGNYAGARQQLDESQRDFGRRSEMLFLLEKGFLLHLEGKYRESADTFERAKSKYDALYTTSVSGIVSSLAFTDYSLDYRGEDFERVLVNVFQALNYVMLGEYDEARVEAKDADSKLAVINSRYPEKQKNVYREDAFCRLLMGLLYEASTRPEDADDACVWFRQAFQSYRNDYSPHYGTQPPSFLRDKAAVCPPLFPRERRPAEVYVIQYKGLSPLKQEIMVPVPLLNGYMSSLAFPRYYVRPSRISSSELVAKDSRGQPVSAAAECGEDVGAIAVKNLEDRKVRAIALAALKSAGKYAAITSQENSVAKHYGFTGLELYKFLSSLYFLTSNRADLRSWQTLPEKIMISRISLPPGEYTFEFVSRDSSGAVLQRVDLGKSDLIPAEKKFYIVRSPF